MAPHRHGDLIVSDRCMIMAEPVGFTPEGPSLGRFFHAVGPINRNDDDDRQLVPNGRFQLLQVKSKGTVACHTVHGFIRPRQLGADGIWQAGAQMAVVHGIYNRPLRPGHMIMNAPQCRIAPIHDHDGIVREEFIAHL